MSTKPAHKIRRGHLTAVIWRNYSSERGTTWYSVELSRGYKDSDDKWRNTDSLGEDDLLPARKLLDEADTWIWEQKRADAQARREKKEAEAVAA